MATWGRIVEARVGFTCAIAQLEWRKAALLSMRCRQRHHTGESSYPYKTGRFGNPTGIA